MIEINIKYGALEQKEIVIPVVKLHGNNSLSIKELAMIFVMLHKGLYSNSFLDQIVPHLTDDQLKNLSELIGKSLNINMDTKEQMLLAKAKVPIINPDGSVNQIEESNE